MSRQSVILITLPLGKSPEGRLAVLTSREHVFAIISRKHLRTKVTPDFHLIYSKNGGNLGSKSK